VYHFCEAEKEGRSKSPLVFLQKVKAVRTQLKWERPIIRFHCAALGPGFPEFSSRRESASAYFGARDCFLDFLAAFAVVEVFFLIETFFALGLPEETLGSAAWYRWTSRA
jgi:hypothetical protein